MKRAIGLVSVVIPARNEEATIARCIESVKRELLLDKDCEILVVDNLSTDATASIARQCGAIVVISDASTIAGVRNHGASQSSGSIFLFLDADCYLGAGWKAAFDRHRATLESSHAAFVGSHPFPPAGESVFLWRYWFTPFVHRQTRSHLGSAHLLCNRDLFELLGGFNEGLSTGEDYELCQRLTDSGGEIVVDRGLTAIHDGYPRNLVQFMRRELWHGMGDTESFRSALRSRVAIAGLLFLGSTIAAVTTSALGMFIVAATFAIGAAGVLIASAFARFRGSPFGTALVASTCILPLYLLARGAAFGIRWRHWQ